MIQSPDNTKKTFVQIDSNFFKTLKYQQQEILKSTSHPQGKIIV